MKNLIVILLLLVLCSTASAVPEEPGDGTGGGGGLSIGTDTFSKNISWDQLSALDPLTGFIMVIGFTVFLFSAGLAIVASGTKINLGTIFKSNDLRNEGQKGAWYVLASALIIVVAFIGLIIIWNSFGPGTW